MDLLGGQARIDPFFDLTFIAFDRLGTFISPDEDHDFSSLTQAVVEGAAKLSKLGQSNSNR